MFSDIARMMSKTPKETKVLKEWKHAGLKCKVMQCGFSINGYVELKKKHPYFGKEYDDVNVDVHGGLTYGEQEGDVFVLGFDTAHGFSGTWSQERVEKETERLAEQLAEVKK